VYTCVLHLAHDRHRQADRQPDTHALAHTCRAAPAPPPLRPHPRPLALLAAGARACARVQARAHAARLSAASGGPRWQISQCVRPRTRGAGAQCRLHPLAHNLHGATGGRSLDESRLQAPAAPPPAPTGTRWRATPPAATPPPHVSRHSPAATSAIASARRGAGIQGPPSHTSWRSSDLWREVQRMF